MVVLLERSLYDTSDEIALSIIAEIVQKLRNAEQLNWALFQQAEADASDAEQTTACCGSTGGQAVDPICEMTVEIDGARFTSEYDGVTYYFCCAGCKQTFDRQPEAHLT